MIFSSNTKPNTRHGKQPPLPPTPHSSLFLPVAGQIPGDPPLSLVAAWAVHPECLGPDSPDSLRRFFGLFYRLVDIPLSAAGGAAEAGEEEGARASRRGGSVDSTPELFSSDSESEGGEDGGHQAGEGECLEDGSLCVFLVCLLLLCCSLLCCLVFEGRCRRLLSLAVNVSVGGRGA